jgi:2-C-methyl-D-erythritol 4-phosphate cytidylyltransferase
VPGHAEAGSGPLDDVEAIVQAAGAGERLGRGPKAFLGLGGQTLLERAIAVMRVVATRVTVAVPPVEVERARDLCAGRAAVIAGGATRRETLCLLMDGARAPWVVLHDIVHPFVTPALARRVLETARARGAAVAAVRSTSSAYRADATGAAARIPAGDVWLTRKPWAFRREDFARGLASPGDAKEGVGGFLTRAGQAIALVDAESWNIKLTTTDDWRLAEAIERASGSW